MEGTARELKIYEYRVKATPEFVYIRISTV